MELAITLREYATKLETANIKEALPLMVALERIVRKELRRVEQEAWVA